MIRVKEQINIMLDSIEIRAPVVTPIPCRPNLAKVAPIPQQAPAVIASTIPNIAAQISNNWPSTHSSGPAIYLQSRKSVSKNNSSGITFLVNYILFIS